MNDKKDGGPAFPGGNRWDDWGKRIIPSTDSGMSLRDWFAGMALSGAIANPLPVSKEHQKMEFFAKASYAYADAMLKARSE